MTYQIRQATIADAEIIADFNTRLAAESEGKVLDQSKLLPGVRALLQDEHKGVYHLACDAVGKSIGQVMYTYEWSDWRNGWFWWIQSVYVTAEHRGKGVFRQIYAHLQKEAQAQGNVIGFRLYVEEDNKSAHEVYAKSGFTRPGYFVMEHLT
jgi:GNAT superfamily N-acetyltransferase